MKRTGLKARNVFVRSIPSISALRDLVMDLLMSSIGNVHQIGRNFKIAGGDHG